MSNLSKIRLGTAPDSWGVWFPTDPHQVSWDTYLDEISRVGYTYTELGPQGFLPQDPSQLRDELAQRQLSVSGGTVSAGLHRGQQALDEAIAAFSQEARLLQAVGAEYLIQLPEQYTDLHGGGAADSSDIDPAQWNDLTAGTNTLGKILHDEYGIKLVFHPHADTHVDTQDRVEQFLTDTDPQYVNLCLDTGHISYCFGDNLDIIAKHPDRITYVHLKSVDPQVRDRARAENLSLAEAVPLGVMCEPPYGEPDMPPLLNALGDLDRDLFAIIEQDLYPVEPHIPLPIGARTAGYYVGCGIGPVRRWPY